jgi:hypothetical protein
MLKKTINYIDMLTFEKSIEGCKLSLRSIYESDDNYKVLPDINIIGVGQLGGNFIEYCNNNNKWNNDNSIFINSLENSLKRERLRKIAKNLQFMCFDEYLVKEHKDNDINIFLYNLSELGEFDKFIGNLLKIKSPYNVVFGIKTKHSKLQFDIIIRKLSKDIKLPIVLIDEEKLLEETNNYIIYELYDCARNFVES